MAQEPVTWRDGPDLLALAALIIAAHHPHLLGFPIRFAWRSRAKKVGKTHVALGTCEIVSGRFFDFVATEGEKAAAEDAGTPQRMFWIEIAEDRWETLTEEQRLALLDHELCHAAVDYPEEKPGPELYLRSHDLETFNDEVRRHGLWSQPLEDFAAVVLGFEGT